MSSPARTLGPLPTTSQLVNAKKRVLSDSEDTEDRDVKRVKPQGTLEDLNKRTDSKGEKKRRRKKKRKVSVVKAEPSDTETLATASRSPVPRLPSRSVSSAVADTIETYPVVHVKLEDARQPSAGPSNATAAAPASPLRTSEDKMVDATVRTMCISPRMFSYHLLCNVGHTQY